MGEHRASDKSGVEVSALVEQTVTEITKYQRERDAAIDRSMAKHPAGKHRKRK